MLDCTVWTTFASIRQLKILSIPDGSLYENQKLLYSKKRDKL